MTFRLPALTLLVAVVTAASATSAAAAAIPGPLTRHTLRCHQSYASYGPMGNLDHYGYLSSWTLRIAPAGDTYTAGGEGIDPTGTLTGAMRYHAGQVRFTDGPFHNRKAGWVLAGTYVRGGVRMPHDTVKGRRFPLVLRSVHTKRNDAAPPRRQTDALSFFFCR